MGEVKMSYLLGIYALIVCFGNHKLFPCDIEPTRV